MKTIATLIALSFALLAGCNTFRGLGQDMQKVGDKIEDKVAQVMQKFTVHKGLVAPMDRENVDTDAIIPKQFLKSIRKTGFGPNLFDDWRYLDHGEPGQDPASRKPNPDFVLNQPRYQGASDPAGAQELRLRLVARARALGARPVRLPRHHRAELRRHLLQQLLQERPAADRAARVAGGRSCSTKSLAFPGYQLTIDLERQVVVKPAGRGAAVRGAGLPQVLPDQRLRRHRPDPAPVRQDQGLRGRAPGHEALAGPHAS